MNNNCTIEFKGMSLLTPIQRNVLVAASVQHVVIFTSVDNKPISLVIQHKNLVVELMLQLVHLFF